MSRNSSGKALSRQQSFVTTGNSGGGVIDERVLLRSTEISRGRVEYGVVFSVMRRPTPGLGKCTLPGLGSIEYGTGKDSRGRCSFRCRRAVVRIGKTAREEVSECDIGTW